ncbi:MAG TPA: phosphotransferase [Rhizomicrobium sp.]|nr:phosphotransferase [Rhizomicrobium sp.]
MRTALRRLSPASQAIEPLAAPSDVSCVFAGHSGATITLYGSGVQAYVRKQAADVARNERLMRQAEKQRLLCAHGVALPRVLGEGVGEDKRAFFDMEYVPGRTVADAVIHAAPIDRAALLRSLGNLLWLFQMQQGDALSPALFHAKIDEIGTKCATRMPTNRRMAEIWGCGAKLMAYDWDGVPQSPCHGDLTLENILLTRKRGIVFIDCDEPFASSWWLDVAKLFQDVQGHWCIRTLYGTAEPAQFLNAVQKIDQLSGDLYKLVANDALREKLPQLTALHLFRCLPYVKQEDVVNFVCARIQHVLNA